MACSIIVFEDHSLANFRPLAWSVPTYELRTGIFNTRERMEQLAQGAPGQYSQAALLCRGVLAPLHTCQGWPINPRVLDTQAERVLWVNGRYLGREIPAGGVLQDDQGLVAADLSLAESQELLKSWHQWNDRYRGSELILDPWEGLPAGRGQATDLPALKYIWDLVPALPEMLRNDLSLLQEGRCYTRHPFGLFPGPDKTLPVWRRETHLQPRFSAKDDGVWLGPEVRLAEGTAFETSNGPVILDRGVRVLPHCYLEGPLYIGPGSIVKAGATLYGESSFGIGNRLAGEIGESCFGDFANKQHDGFIGHAVIGSWTNLGALTTCSDLKNNYGPVRVDLGRGAMDTGLRFVGLMMGDHAKTAIGTLFNTGTVVGFASNIFGGTMPPKWVPNYSWGGFEGAPAYQVERAMSTAATVMERRGCLLISAGRDLMRLLA